MGVCGCHYDGEGGWQSKLSVTQTLLSFLGFVECLGNGLSVEGAAGEGLGAGSLTTVDANVTCLGVEAASTPIDGS